MGESGRDRAVGAHPKEAGNGRTSGPSIRSIAGGRNWSIREFICTAGPGDRPFEERHDAVSISIVTEGSFTYTSDTGRALLHPGALLLGNHGACYQCGHDHSVGDRCISLQIEPEYFAAIAATAAGSSKFRFPVAMLPAKRDMLPLTVMLEAIGNRKEPLSIEEDLVRFMAAAIRGFSGVRAVPARATALDERRISRSLRYIEQYPNHALNLTLLANIAAMSKFHFLRVFSRIVGMTPYQYVLDIRLRQAALCLLDSEMSILMIALESGFGDLSTFNAAFRTRFGMSPTAFRSKKAADLGRLKSIRET